MSESQKPTTDEYRDAWERIWGKKKSCPKCEQDAEIAAGHAIKCVIVFHNCGKPNGV